MTFLLLSLVSFMMSASTILWGNRLPRVCVLRSAVPSTSLCFLSPMRFSTARRFSVSTFSRRTLPSQAFTSNGQALTSVSKSSSLAEQSAPRVLVPIAPGCEELEAVALTDILHRAGAAVTTAFVGPSTTTLGPYIVTCSKGTQLAADYHIQHLEADFDAILLPGGIPGAIHLRDNVKFEQMIKRIKRLGGWIGAICASPSVVLQHYGMLSEPGLKATGFPSALLPVLQSGLNIYHEKELSTLMDFVPEEDLLAVQSGTFEPGVDRRAYPRVVVSNRFITAIGPGSCMEFAIACVACLLDRERANQVMGGLLMKPFFVHYHDDSYKATELFTPSVPVQKHLEKKNEE